MRGFDYIFPARADWVACPDAGLRLEWLYHTRLSPPSWPPQIINKQSSLPHITWRWEMALFGIHGMGADPWEKVKCCRSVDGFMGQRFEVTAPENNRHQNQVSRLVRCVHGIHLQHAPECLKPRWNISSAKTVRADE